MQFVDVEDVARLIIHIADNNLEGIGSLLDRSH